MEKLIFIFVLAFQLMALGASPVAASTAVPYAPFVQSLNLATQKSIQDSTKGRLQVIYFWASWCPDCKAKLKVDLSRYQTSEIDFLTLSIEDKKEKVMKFVEKEKVAYPVFFDPERTLQKDLKIFSVPTVVLAKLVDGKLQIIQQVSGKDWESIDLSIQSELKRM